MYGTLGPERTVWDEEANSAMKSDTETKEVSMKRSPDKKRRNDFSGTEDLTIISTGQSICVEGAPIQHMWPSMWILIAMEAVLILVTAGAGILDVLLEEANISLTSLI